MRSTRNRSPQPSVSASNQKMIAPKRLKTKPALIIMGILLLGNILWFIGWLIPSDKPQDVNEQVASVDGTPITRQQWIVAMESLYGKETLQTLVNEAVVEKAAVAYNIKVSDKEIDMELSLMRSAQDQFDTSMQNLTAKQLRQKVRSQLLLEKVLTKDVVIDKEKIEAYYDDNKSLFHIQTTYRTNLIVVATKNDAQSVLRELKEGSSFAVLARERSLDTASASLGGDIGFISADEKSIDQAIPAALDGMKAGQTSKAFKIEDGRYGIIHVSEVLEGQSFNYDEVKEHIQRQLALEQLPQTVTAEALWSEFDATWFYGER